MPPRLCPKPCAARRLAHHLAPRRCPALRRSISAVTAPPSHETVNVPCRSNGLITLDIFHAAKPSSPIIIHLPSGPVLPDVHDEEERVISLLRETTGATIARINYRASPNHQYPTPFHDVLYGFDWMGVVGELLGGSLATMLALTECRPNESRIAAAAVNSPIVDWVFPEHLPILDPSKLPEPMAPDETAFPADADYMASQLPVVEPATPKSLKRTPKVPPQTAWQRYGDNKIIPNVTLAAERDVLFSNPEDYLDRFASPIHFFRSPRAQLILPQQDDMFASSQPDEVLDMEVQMSLDHYNAVHHQASSTPELPILSPCRAYARNYPPAGSMLSLPAWDITIGMESPLAAQAAELTKVLRRSVARQYLKSYAERTRWHDATEKEKYQERAAGIVHLNEVAGLGLWTEQSDATWETNMQRIGTWMKQHLRSGKI